jgi:hypothetical protein
MKTENWFGLNIYVCNPPEHKPGVYGIQNLLTKKWYIGIGQDLAVRALDYTNPDKASIGPKFRFTLLKNELRNFIIVPLFYQLNYNRDQLLAVETELIAVYNSVQNGYNVIENTTTGPGYGEEFRALCKAVHNQPEMIIQHSEVAFAQWADPVAKQKRVKINIEVWNRPEKTKARADSLLKIASSPEILKKRGRSVSKFLKENPFIYVTNGIENRKLFSEEIPKGFRKGLTHRNKPTGRPRSKARNLV